MTLTNSTSKFYISAKMSPMRFPSQLALSKLDEKLMRDQEERGDLKVGAGGDYRN